jgi:hypothetical protein
MLSSPPVLLSGSKSKGRGLIMMRGWIVHVLALGTMAFGAAIAFAIP